MNTNRNIGTSCEEPLLSSSSPLLSPHIELSPVQSLNVKAKPFYPEFMKRGFANIKDERKVEVIPTSVVNQQECKLALPHTSTNYNLVYEGESVQRHEDFLNRLKKDSQFYQELKKTCESGKTLTVKQYSISIGNCK